MEYIRRFEKCTMSIHEDNKLFQHVQHSATYTYRISFVWHVEQNKFDTYVAMCRASSNSKYKWLRWLFRLFIINLFVQQHKFKVNLPSVKNASQKSTFTRNFNIHLSLSSALYISKTDALDGRCFQNIKFSDINTAANMVIILWYRLLINFTDVSVKFCRQFDEINNEKDCTKKLYAPTWSNIELSYNFVLYDERTILNCLLLLWSRCFYCLS